MSIIERCINKAISIYTADQRKRNVKKSELEFFAANPEAKEVLKNNEQFHNAYQGKRCFVLGNGPSLKEIDLSILKDEYTFTVNQIARRVDFPKLHTNFHFWADPAFFRIDLEKPEDLELLNVMKSVDTEDNHPIVFFPYDQRGFAKTHDLEKKLHIHYYVSRNETKIETIDYTDFVPAFHTVVQWCITMAIYMGFTEIYLLGCDNTSLINQIQLAAGKDDFVYGYDVSENEKKRMDALLESHSLRAYVYSYMKVLEDYKKLYDYCNEHNLKLFNCTKHSAIDCIPKKELCIVFGNSK